MSSFLDQEFNIILDYYYYLSEGLLYLITYYNFSSTILAAFRENILNRFEIYSAARIMGCKIFYVMKT